MTTCQLLDYRDRGFLPAAMVNYLALLGWGLPDGSEIRLDPLWSSLPLFDIADVNDSSASFDAKKLRFVNAEHLRALPVTEFARLVEPFVAAEPWADRFHAGTFGRIAADIQVRAETLAEVPAQVDFLFRSDPDIDEASWTKAMVPEAAGWIDASSPPRRSGRGRPPSCISSRSPWPTGSTPTGGSSRPRSASRSQDGPSARRCSSRWRCWGATRSCAG